MPIFIPSGGVLKKSKDIYIPTVGVLKKCKKVYSPSNGTIKKCFSSSFCLKGPLKEHKVYEGNESYSVNLSGIQIDAYLWEYSQFDLFIGNTSDCSAGFRITTMIDERNNLTMKAVLFSKYSNTYIATISSKVSRYILYTIKFKNNILYLCDGNTIIDSDKTSGYNLPDDYKLVALKDDFSSEAIQQIVCPCTI